MKKDIFSRTRLKKFKVELEKEFPSSEKIYKRACRILVKELREMDDRGNKMVAMHLSKNILPGYACYRVLLDAGIEQGKAIGFVERLLCDSAQGMGRLCKLLSRKKYGFPVFDALFNLGFKTGFPKEGWTIEWIKHNKKCIRFNITSCMYCEELKKRNALELCKAFCKMDHITYDPLAPSVIFERKSTLAEMGEKCDFCFRKGSI